MQLEIRVVPNAKNFLLSLKDGMIKMRVRAKAEGGKANEELVRELSGLLGLNVSIAAGGKGRVKRLEVDGEEGAVMELLRKIADNYVDKKIR